MRCFLLTLKYNSSCDDFKYKLINMDEKINSLLEDLVFYFEANNTCNVTNEFINRCKQAQSQQLLLYSVVKSFYCFEESMNMRLKCDSECDYCKSIKIEQ